MDTKNEPGAFDCYERAEPDEPMFVLLARDRLAPELVRRWVAERRAAGEDPAQVQEALECAFAMHEWWLKHRAPAVQRRAPGERRVPPLFWHNWPTLKALEALNDVETVRGPDDYDGEHA